MTILLTIIHIIACLLLVVVIMVQGGRGQGLSGPSFSSGNVQTLFGTQAADFLTKATTVAAILFLFTCLGLNFIETRKSKSLLQAGQKAPVDMEAVKKALEKIKAEAAATAGAAKDKAVEAKDAVQAKAGEAAANLKEQAAAPVAAASAAAAQAAASAAPAVPAPAASPKP